MIAATTMVAGLLAGFMTDDLSPADTQLKLYSIARPRVGGGRNVMYNGEQTPRVLVPASSWTENSGKPPLGVGQNEPNAVHAWRIN